MIDLGAVYGAAIDIHDGTGALANAASVTLTITLPDATTVTPAVPNPPASTGQYRYSYVTVQPGRHVATWSTTGPVTAYRDVFDVGEDAVPSIVSLADAKDFLGIAQSDTSEDDELRAWLAGCTQVIEREKNEVIARRAVTQTEFNEHPRSVRLWKLPVIELTSLAAADDSRTWDVTSDVRTDPETGLVRRISGPQMRGWITASYTAGYQVVPYHVMQASLVLLQHVWETQRGPGTIGGGIIGPEEAADFKQMYMLPRKVREWLGQPRPAVI